MGQLCWPFIAQCGRAAGARETGRALHLVSMASVNLAGVFLSGAALRSLGAG